jgi:hypothetical protein
MGTNGGDEIVMPCKEPECTESVRYRRIIVFGYTNPSVPVGGSTTKRVYLECRNGHEHPYEITT